VSRFGDLVKASRLDRGLTLEAVAKAIGSHKGYISGIETGNVNPPSLKLIKKYALLFDHDLRTLVLLAWVDKAPVILREDAERFLEWSQKGLGGSLSVGRAGDPAPRGSNRPPPPSRTSEK
jgi:transcriptional regulator with XRE-family HTH domain